MFKQNIKNSRIFCKHNDCVYTKDGQYDLSYLPDYCNLDGWYFETHDGFHGPFETIEKATRLLYRYR